ncbi:unnamed protein product [Boreogadus saida]
MVVHLIYFWKRSSFPGATEEALCHFVSSGCAAQDLGLMMGDRYSFILRVRDDTMMTDQVAHPSAPRALGGLPLNKSCHLCFPVHISVPGTGGAAAPLISEWSGPQNHVPPAPLISEWPGHQNHAPPAPLISEWSGPQNQAPPAPLISEWPGPQDHAPPALQPQDNHVLIGHRIHPIPIETMSF